MWTSRGWSRIEREAPLTTLDRGAALAVIELQKDIIKGSSLRPDDGVDRTRALLDILRAKNLPVALANATEKIVSRRLERRSAAS